MKTCQAASYVLKTAERRGMGAITDWLNASLPSPLLVDWDYPDRTNLVLIFPTRKARVRLLLAEGTTEEQLNEFLGSIPSVVSIERTSGWTPYMIGEKYERGDFMLRGY